MKLISKLFMSLMMVVLMSTGSALAAGGKTKPVEHHHWSFTGINGKYDKDALQRGFQVYREVCSACHSLDYIAFRHLGDKGGPFYLDECPEGAPDTLNCSNPNDNPLVKALAAEYEVQDGPDDAGDMFMRAGLPSDTIPGPYANEQQAAAANGGAIPPDLSLIAKARHHGPDYIYSLLKGYEDPPETVTLDPGTYYNPYYGGDMSTLLKPEFLDEEGKPLEGVDVPYGGVLKMKAPLAEGIVDYADDSTPETVEQYAEDLTAFLMWTAEPKLEARKQMGKISVLYLLIMAIIVYLSYKQIWSGIEH
ncbi:cytochrome c1 [Parvularcula sp. IMCC14364]|uniref:cytochrome c1 n=1 Tax=Parvularcula sp. IMCC14364 TaxID=3067902 RepID=UPI0027410A1F|nr:cytochrome c1 [Parvularcula sp. IMCC14364]